MSLTKILRADAAILPAVLEEHYAALEKPSARAKTTDAVNDVLQTYSHLRALDPYIRTLHAAAIRIDDRSLAPLNEQKDYHARQHFVEVFKSARVLLKLNEDAHPVKLSPRDQMEVLVAALLHDVLHHGGMNTVPFELELASCGVAEQIMASFGVPVPSRQRIKTMIMATDISPLSNGGRQMLKAIHDYHFEQGPKPDVTAKGADGKLLWDEGQQQLYKRLITNKKLCLQSCVIGDADLLSSTGLGVKTFYKWGYRLSKERGQEYDPAQQRGFLQNFLKSHLTLGAQRVFDDSLRRNAMDIVLHVSNAKRHDLS